MKFYVLIFSLFLFSISSIAVHLPANLNEIFENFEMTYCDPNDPSRFQKSKINLRTLAYYGELVERADTYLTHLEIVNILVEYFQHALAQSSHFPKLFVQRLKADPLYVSKLFDIIFTQENGSSLEEKEKAIALWHIKRKEVSEAELKKQCGLLIQDICCCCNIL